MMQQVPIATQKLENQAQNLWNKFDDINTQTMLTREVREEAQEKFWENYEDLLKQAHRNAKLLKPTIITTPPDRLSPVLQLTGLFMMTEHKLKRFRKSLFIRKQLPSMLITMFLSLMLVALNLGLTLASMIFVIACSSLIIIIRFLLSSATPLENTIIEIQPDKIIRRGTRLTTAVVQLDKINQLKENNLGLTLRQKSFWNNLYYFFSENNTMKNSRVVYIPNVIESYDEIKVFLKDRISKNSSKSS